MTESAYETSPIRRRRTKAEMADIRGGLLSIVAHNQPMTVRQVFYQAVTSGLIGKTEGEYKATVCRLLSEMRRDGDLPYGWIADNTRWMRKPASHSSLDGFLESAQRSYRRDLWDNQRTYVEIWLEKDALSGVLYPITSKWDVPLMVTRGYPSITFLHEAAEVMAGEDKDCHLYYFGDRDPSGVDIDRKVEEDLTDFIEEWETESELHFERIAVQPWQVDAWDLPTRPTKASDTRARNFEGESVEVDAIPPDTLRDLVEDCILAHVDRDALAVVQAVEEREREQLGNLMRLAS